ncbi:phosphopantetheine-binding protein [Arenibacter palladensis]|uniref:phosphopantetheine-binding protein n=1 Tax=Arenibacter palladensis TaxID=237373 RepID=UPI0026E1F8FF|nr:phosphopantetheine-binding protein [Arenibacter palladensis]MDO6601761.1 phosphopantetheine-binding protein [Arenibacter palladensis]
MESDQHFEQLKDIVKMYLPDDVSVDAIEVDSNFVKELNINSANLVDIVLDVEDAFGIRLENEDMDQMQTVQDALIIIAQKLQVKK